MRTQIFPIMALFSIFFADRLDASPSLEEIQQRVTIRDGLALVIGDDLEVAAKLAAEGRMQIHLLVPNAARVQPLRQKVLDRQLGGRVMIDLLPQKRLPHPDRFVNLVIADRDALGDVCLAQSELLRVLAVRGSALLKEDGIWHLMSPKKNTSLDGWFSHWYDASGNCVSQDREAGFPASVQWQHGPAMDDGTADGKIIRVAEGRVVFLDEASGDLICRDAGNGSLLWRRYVGSPQNSDISLQDQRAYLWHEPERLPFDRGNEQGLLTAFDLRNGEIVQVYERGLRAGTAQSVEVPWMGRTRKLTPVPWFAVTDSEIVQAYGPDLVVLDRRTGQRRWTHHIDAATWFSPIVSDDVLLVAEAEHPGRRERNNGSEQVRAVTAFKLSDGEQLWRNTNVHPERKVKEPKGPSLFARSGFKTMSASDGLLLLHISSYQFRTGGAIAILDISTGKEIWRREFAPKELYTQGSQRPVIRDGEVIVLDGTGAYRFSAKTGEPIGDPIKRPKGLKRTGRTNGACTSSRATVDWLMANGWLYVGPDGEAKINQAARGACGQGIIPAHGLMFVAPTPCDCGDYLRGYLALSPDVGEPISNGARLISGVATPKSDAFEAPWPIFLGNPQRTSHTSESLPEFLKKRWSVRVVEPADDHLCRDRRQSERDIGELSAPVVGGGCVVVAAPETHQVIAIDSDTGQVRWRYPAGGKVDTPPTLADGMAIFGCDDGCVYALRLADGELVWRFRAASTDAVAMQHGHLASAHPVPGSVLVLGDRVIGVSGQHTDLGGLHVWSLDLKTGTPQAHRVLSTDAPPALSNNLTVADPDNQGFWVVSPPGGSYGAGGGYHLSPDLKDLPTNDVEPPAMVFDRQGERVRFRSERGRGGSTHGWKGAMRANRFPRLRAHRIALGNDLGFGLIDPTGREKSVVWAIGPGKDAKPIWEQDRGALDNVESLGALIMAGDRLLVGGGARDGTNGRLFLLDAENGKVQKRWELPARVAECGIAVAGKRVYVCCEDGSIHCLAE